MDLQTLTTLDLQYNGIGPDGVTYLADALRHNQVSVEDETLLSFLISVLDVTRSGSGK